jgi:carboxymethylenebutenolidase
MIVTESHLDLETPTGPMRTYAYVPSPPRDRPEKFPGLFLYSEIFQQTEPIRRLAVQFAGQGYVVLVPEVYHEYLPLGTVLGYDDPGKDRGNELKWAVKLSTFDADAKVLIQTLQRHPQCNGRVGVVGVCLGGHLAFRAAFNPEVLATCCMYPTDIHSGTLGEGKSADSLARAKDIRGELLMIWGRQDPHIPAEGRRAVYDALHQADVLFTWHEFNGAHAFMRDEGARYDPAVARQACGLAFDLFARNL